MGAVNNVAKIQVTEVSKLFDTPKGPIGALRNITLSIEDGEFVVVVGASGCGKTTFAQSHRRIRKTYGRASVFAGSRDYGH